MSRTGTNVVRFAVAAWLGLAACLVAWWPQSAAGSGDAVVVSSPVAALPTQKTPTPTPGPTIDKRALRQKYAAERDKRLRPDGNEQYIRLTGQLAHYLEDPYTPVRERGPKHDHVTVAFIGGGFAGLVTGARLKEAGVDDVRIIEKGGDFGGTWYWNRYPGAMCDVESYIYLPLLEEIGRAHV